MEVNFTVLDEPLQKVVAYLDPEEFQSTWLGNKAIYRTRMAMADGGELVILAPGVATFGEDRQIDRLIRKYGYRTTPEIMRLVEQTDDLPQNLSAAAHLIHGSSEGRFTVTYCPGKLSRAEIESVGYRYGDLPPMLRATTRASSATAGTCCPTASESITSASRPWGSGPSRAVGIIRPSRTRGGVWVGALLHFFSVFSASRAPSPSALPQGFIEQHRGRDRDVQAVGRAEHRQPHGGYVIAAPDRGESRRLAAQHDGRRAAVIHLGVRHGGIDPRGNNRERRSRATTPARRRLRFRRPAS